MCVSDLGLEAKIRRGRIFVSRYTYMNIQEKKMFRGSSTFDIARNYNSLEFKNGLIKMRPLIFQVIKRKFHCGPLAKKILLQVVRQVIKSLY